ncbi:MAG: hypothetical protein Q9171_002833 [Xanthocarpia ochracea]
MPILVAPLWWYMIQFIIFVWQSFQIFAALGLLTVQLLIFVLQLFNHVVALGQQAVQNLVFLLLTRLFPIMPFFRITAALNRIPRRDVHTRRNGIFSSSCVASRRRPFCLTNGLVSNILQPTVWKRWVFKTKTFATALSINCLTRGYVAYGGPEPVAGLTARSGMRYLMDATMRGDADVSLRLIERGSFGESSPDELPSTQGRALILKPDGGQDQISVGKDRGNIATLDSITTVNTFTEIVAVSPGNYSEPLENLPKDEQLSDRVTTNSSSENGNLPTEDVTPVENGADTLLVGTMPPPLESHLTSSTEAANDTDCATKASPANMVSAILIIPLETLITNAVRACGSSGSNKSTAPNTASANGAEAGYKKSRMPTSCSSKGSASCGGESSSHECSRCIESRNIPCDAHHPLNPKSLRRPLSSLSESTPEDELVTSLSASKIGSVFQDAIPTSELGLRWPKGTKRPHPRMYEVPTTCVQLDELGDLLSRWTLDSDAAATPCSTATTPVDTLRHPSKQWAFRIPRECVWRQQARVIISPSDDVSLPPSGKPSATTAPEPQKTDSPVVEQAGPSRAKQDTPTTTASNKPEAADALEEMVISGTIPPSLRRIFAEARRKTRGSKPANKAVPKKSLKAQGRRVLTPVDDDSDYEPTRVPGPNGTENEARVPVDELPQQPITQQVEQSMNFANRIPEPTSPSSPDKADSTVRPPLDVCTSTPGSSTDTRTINAPDANPRAPVQSGNGRPLTYIIRNGRVTRHLFTPKERLRPEEMDYTYDDDSEDELDVDEDVKMTDSDNDSGYVSNVSPVVNSPMEGASSCMDTDVDMDEPELQQHVDHQPIYDTAMDLDDPSSCDTRSSSAAARGSEERERWEREPPQDRVNARNRTAPPFYDDSREGEIKEGANDGDSPNKKDGLNDEDADDEHESDG